MDPNTIPSVIQKSLDVLSAKFGTTGVLLWHAAVTYTRFYWISCTVGWFIVLAAIFVSAWYWPKPMSEYCSDIAVWLYLRRIIMGVCVILLGIVIGVNFPGIACPQGALLLQLIGK